MAVRMVRVGDVLHQVRRTTPVSATETYPMVGARNFARGSFDAGSLRGTDTKYRELQLVKAGDLIYPKLGAWEGAFSFVDPDLGDRYTSPEYCVFTICSTEADAAYLRHLFAWEPFWRSLAARSTGTNVRRRRLQPGAFLDGRLPLPDLPEQQHIAARLNHVANIRAFPSATAQLDRSIHALLREGPDRPLAAALDLELDEFPVDHDAVYARAGVLGFGRGLFAHGPMRGSETKYPKLRRIHTGQLVMSRLKAFEGAVAVAPSAFDGAVVSQEFVTFTLKAPADSDWVDALCRWPAFWEALRATSTGIGARRERVGADALLTLEVPYPGDAARRRISALQRSRLRVASLEEARERLRTAVLPAARNETLGHLT